MKVLSSLAISSLLLSHVQGEEVVIKELRPDLHLKHSTKSLMERKQEYWNEHRSEFKLMESLRNNPLSCENGKVSFFEEDYSCEDVDFLSFVGIPELIIDRGANFTDETNECADIWGWLSPSGREITILCMQNGVQFIDTTNPVDPVILGNLPSDRHESTWCDVKVSRSNYAFIVKDRGISDPEAGKAVQIFDLMRLEGLDGSEQVTFTTDADYKGHGSSHNIISNVETDFMYTCGARGGENCSTGLHIIDVKDPLNPTFAGCAGDDGYVHDAQCLIYPEDAPDARFHGREICLGFDVDAMTIWDMTDKANIERISRTPYSGSHYTHQGWFLPTYSHVLLDDELDETEGALTRTRTYIFDVSDLYHPIRTGHYDHPHNAIDHNLYVWGDIHKRGFAGNLPMENPPSDRYAYHANYASGLRVVDISRATENPPVMKEVGHFDVCPDIEARAFFGSWSTYMHPSGNVAVSSIERGLFMLRPRMVFGETAAPTPYPTSVDGPELTRAPVVAPTAEEPALSKEGTITIAVVVFGMIFLMSFVALVAVQVLKAVKTKGVEAKAASEAGTENPAFEKEVKGGI